MKLKTMLCIAAFTPLAAFASIPTQCPTPMQIRVKALNNQLHSMWNLKRMTLGKWYLDSSADSPSEAPKEIATLVHYSDWVLSDMSKTGLNGAAVKCAYYSPSFQMDKSNDGIIQVDSALPRKFSPIG